MQTPLRNRKYPQLEQNGEPPHYDLRVRENLNDIFQIAGKPEEEVSSGHQDRQIYIHLHTLCGQRRAWLLLGWVTAKRSCPCKQPACPAIGDGSEVTFKPLIPSGSAARDPHGIKQITVGPPHGIKQITVGPPHGIKQITMFIRENVECLDSSFTTTTTIKIERNTSRKKKEMVHKYPTPSCSSVGEYEPRSCHCTRKVRIREFKISITRHTISGKRGILSLVLDLLIKTKEGDVANCRTFTRKQVQEVPERLFPFDPAISSTINLETV
ncbi:hypothetical protein J6590_059451 [Homalodisca vitripennis]|nr:hypothetical protein J6590_059451 [Homalodisca vitripennis]